MAAKFLPYLLAGISVGGQYALIAIGSAITQSIVIALVSLALPQILLQLTEKEAIFPFMQGILLSLSGG